MIAALAASTLALGSCVAAGGRYETPELAADAIIESLEKGEEERAEQVLEAYPRSSTERDVIYATLFGAAEERYTRLASGEAARILEFVTENYPAAVAAKEALVLALFLERANAGQADSELEQSLRTAVADLRESQARPTAWVELVETQMAIDAGNSSEARASFDRFLAGWDGEPEGILVYVEDIDRYLQSH